MPIDRWQINPRDGQPGRPCACTPSCTARRPYGSTSRVGHAIRRARHLHSLAGTGDPIAMRELEERGWSEWGKATVTPTPVPDAAPMRFGTEVEFTGLTFDGAVTWLSQAGLAADP